MPAFGRMYGGLQMYVDSSLARCPELVFEGGTHHEEIKMPMSEYLRIERPNIVPLAASPAAA